MIACPEATASSWGHSVDNKVKLSRTWGAASVTCLVLGNYTSHYHIHSIHAILILHSYEHLIGSSNQWMALRSVAVVIAKGLGLHRYVQEAKMWSFVFQITTVAWFLLQFLRNLYMLTT
jgi:hypothetical protein